VVLTVSYTFQIQWAPGGQAGVMQATVNSNPLAGTLGFTGVVTSGPLKGDKVYAIGPFVPNLDCLLSGLTSLTGANQKVFS
jgi:hypothetical protein